MPSSIGAGSEREKGFIAAIAAFYADADKVDHGTRARAYRDQLEALTQRFPRGRRGAHLPRARAARYGAGDRYLARAAAARRRDPQRGARDANRSIRASSTTSSTPSTIPPLAELALPAARVYAEIAPASPHAQHMPSHIFTRLGLWQESIRSNLDSEASANAIAAKKQPGAVSYDALHALDYLEYAYLQTGQIDEAKKAMERALRGGAVDPQFSAGYAIAAIPARYALEQRAWKDAAAITAPKAALPWDRFPYALACTHFARAIGAARLGDAAAAKSAVDAIADDPRAARGEADRRSVRLDRSRWSRCDWPPRRGWRTRSTRTTRRWTWRGAPPISRIASASTR